MKSNPFACAFLVYLNSPESHILGPKEDEVRYFAAPTEEELEKWMAAIKV
jgi:hypothetical protein